MPKTERKGKIGGTSLMMHWVTRRPLPIGSFPVCLRGSGHLETNREELPAELTYFRRKSPWKDPFAPAPSWELRIAIAFLTKSHSDFSFGRVIKFP